MGVNPKDFETHADRIDSDYSDEIAWRCAISRKYYCIFHQLRQRHPSEFQMGGGDHGRAKKLARKKGGKSLADDLDDLHASRKRSDYEINDNIEELDLRTFEQELQQFIISAKTNNLL